jgi:hypothetical protein
MIWVGRLRRASRIGTPRCSSAVERRLIVVGSQFPVRGAFDFGSRMARNKPNFPPGRGLGDQGRGCDYAKQTQFARLRRVRRGLGDGGREANAPNKPNSRRAQQRPRRFPASPPPNRLRQTRPNLGGLGYLGDGTLGEPVMRNKPNSIRGRESQVLGGRRVMVNYTCTGRQRNKVKMR